MSESLKKLRQYERAKGMTLLMRLADAGDSTAIAALDTLRKHGWTVPHGTPPRYPTVPHLSTPPSALQPKELMASTRARARRSKIEEGELPGMEVGRGEVWQQVEQLAALYRQLFKRPCFVTDDVVKAIGSWLKRRSYEHGRRLLYLRASVPAWNAAAGREEPWSKGSLQSLYDDRGFYAGKQKEPLYENLLGRFQRLPTWVREIVDGNGDSKLFEAAAGDAAPERDARQGVVPAQGPVPSRFFRPD